jgi:hypothetical protein
VRESFKPRRAFRWAFARYSPFSPVSIASASSKEVGAQVAASPPQEGPRGIYTRADWNVRAGASVQGVRIFRRRDGRGDLRGLIALQWGLARPCQPAPDAGKRCRF